MWIRCVNALDDKEIMINLDKIESIQYDCTDKVTVLYVDTVSTETRYKIKGTPDNLFNALRRRGEATIV